MEGRASGGGVPAGEGPSTWHSSDQEPTVSDSSLHAHLTGKEWNYPAYLYILTFPLLFLILFFIEVKFTQHKINHFRVNSGI